MRPQFEDADQLVDVTDQIGSIPELATASPGHLTVATYEGRLYGVPLYADVSALFYNKDPLRAGRPRSREAADQPGRDPRVRRQDHGARRRHQWLLPAGQLRRLQHLHRRPADVGIGSQDRSRGPRRRAARRRRRQAGPPVGPRHGQGRQRPRERPGRERRDVPPPVRIRQGRDDGHRQLQHHARPRPDGRSPFEFGISLLPGVEAGSRPRSSVATSSSSRRAARASTTPSTS